MAYDVLSGTIALPGELLSDGQVSASIFQGDGQDIYNIPRITSNASTDNLLTVGANANSMVGEPNLTFDGTALTLTGQLTASAGVSSSFFYGDGSRLTNIPAGSATASGPTYSLQFHNSDGDLSGSSSLLFQNSTLKITSGLTLSRRAVTAHTTASLTDYYIGVDSTNAPVEVKLLDAAVLSSGQTFVVKDEGGFSSTNNITIIASGSQLIDGQNSIVLQSPHAAISLYCNGSNKFYIC